MLTRIGVSRAELLSLILSQLLAKSLRIHSFKENLPGDCPETTLRETRSALVQLGVPGAKLLLGWERVGRLEFLDSYNIRAGRGLKIILSKSLCYRSLKLGPGRVNSSLKVTK